ncbi:uncharacterized protein LOC127726066 [Mytilus californianus]|uniref:uncharacterized protein LOC127726066 n=1 Tax=Mytilus californianus TaxID=6549 RepID=UPI002245286F|nr:uncharacterized protein LOC127726066 [Mytilus californianus]
MIISCLLRNSKHRLFQSFICKKTKFSSSTLTTSAVLHQEREEGKCAQNKKVKVLYDGQCPICAIEINLMKKLNKKDNVVNFVDIAVGEYKPDDHLGITYSQAMGKMHVIVTHANNTESHSKPEVTKIYDSMEGMKVMYNAVGLTWLSKLLSYPGVKETSDRFYRWFAVNRYRMTGRDKEECESERCNISDKKK